jgi:signal transduction histidine kinase
MLGHELRNPLGAVTAAVELLNRVEHDSSLAVSARRIIARQVHHLAQLMNDLLDAARAAAGKITLDRHEEDLAHVVQRAYGALEVAGLMRSHHVELSLDPVWSRWSTTC